MELIPGGNVNPSDCRIDTTVSVGLASTKRLRCFQQVEVNIVEWKTVNPNAENVKGTSRIKIFIESLLRDEA
jgi:hypothetical protein